MTRRSQRRPRRCTWITAQPRTRCAARRAARSRNRSPTAPPSGCRAFLVASGACVPVPHTRTRTRSHAHSTYRQTHTPQIRISSAHKMCHPTHRPVLPPARTHTPIHTHPDPPPHTHTPLRSASARPTRCAPAWRTCGRASKTRATPASLSRLWAAVRARRDAPDVHPLDCFKPAPPPRGHAARAGAGRGPCARGPPSERKLRLRRAWPGLALSAQPRGACLSAAGARPPRSPCTPNALPPPVAAPPPPGPLLRSNHQGSYHWWVPGRAPRFHAASPGACLDPAPIRPAATCPCDIHPYPPPRSAPQARAPMTRVLTPPPDHPHAWKNRSRAAEAPRAWAAPDHIHSQRPSR